MSDQHVVPDQHARRKRRIGSGFITELVTILHRHASAQLLLWNLPEEQMTPTTAQKNDDGKNGEMKIPPIEIQSAESRATGSAKKAVSDEAKPAEGAERLPNSASGEAGEESSHTKGGMASLVQLLQKTAQKYPAPVLSAGAGVLLLSGMLIRRHKLLGSGLIVATLGCYYFLNRPAAPTRPIATP